MDLQSDSRFQALLRLTAAINRNSPSSELISLFAGSVLQHAGVKILLVYLYRNETWELKFQEGTDPRSLPWMEPYLQLTEEKITDTLDNIHVCGIHWILPVYHKSHPIGLIAIGWKNKTSEYDREFIRTLAHVLMMAIENKRLARREMEQQFIHREIMLAGDIQRKLLPSELPCDDSLKVKAFYRPYQEVGGDYYDWIPLNRHEYIFCMADVSGKGIPAALLMSNIQACLRSLVGFTHNLKDIILEINKRVWQSARGEQFASMFLGKINLRSQQLTTINAGHCTPLYCENGKLSLLEKGCTLLGIADDLGTVEVELRSYAGALGILLYTDGLTELQEWTEDALIEKNKMLFQQLYAEPEKLTAALQNDLIQYMQHHELKDDVAVMHIFVNDLVF